jgi:hypothetical protein
MGLSEGPDGSLYISESRNGKIWRILFLEEKDHFTDQHLIGMEYRKSRSYLKIPNEKLDDLSYKKPSL